MAVFKRGGNWWIGFPLGNGKYRREKVGPSHALAREVLAKRLNEVAERKNFPARVANGKPFAEIAEKYWELHASHLKQNGVRAMFEEIKRAFGDRRIGAITSEDVLRYFRGIEARASVASANRHLTHVKTIFSKARAWGDFHGQAPCDAVKKGKETAHRLRYLSREEMAELLDKAHPRLYPVLACALLSGMRRGEILGLTWENVALERGTIYLLQTKSGKPREIPICSKLREVFLNLGPKPSGPVFDLPLIMLRRYFERALKDAKIAGLRWHDTRHTFASHFIMRTNDLPALQALLGHFSPTMTLRYAHLGKGHLASEMAAFESAIPAKPTAPAPALAPVADSADPLALH